MRWVDVARVRGWWRGAFAVSAALWAAVLLPGEALAANKTVTKTADTNDGTCSVVDCSLREAIIAASPGDTVVFDAAVTGTITLNVGLGQLVIDKHLTINGPGAGVLAVSGGDAVRVFDIGPTAAVNVTLNGFTVRNGLLTGSSPFTARGGGIRIQNGSNVSLIDMVVRNNEARSAGTGTFAFGGGISSNGQLTLTRTTVKDNIARGGDASTASGAAGRPFGGGIRAEGSTGNALTLIQSTLSGNQAIGGAPQGAGSDAVVSGAALSITGSGAITNSTVSGNVASGPAGSSSRAAIVAHTFGTTLTILNSTVVNNTNAVSAFGSAGGIAADGGNIAITNSIVANNTNNNTPANCLAAFGGVISGSSNLQFGAADCPAGVFPINADPKLTPLQDNGGNTFTHLPLLGSAAINAGQNAGAPAADQRGIARPASGSDPVDIGSVEIPLKVVNSTSDPGAGGCDAAECTLREAVTDVGDNGIILVKVAGTLTLATPILIDKSVAIVGPGAAGLAISGNNATRIFTIGSVNAGKTISISGLTLRNGRVTAATGQGGAIHTAVTSLALSDMVFTNNQALGSGTVGDGQGGALYVASGGVVTIDRTTLVNNLARGAVSAGGGDGSGGAIYSDGNLTVRTSTFESNTAQGGTGTLTGGDGLGGAVFIPSTASATSISNSTFSLNTAAGGGSIATVGIGKGGAVHTLRSAVVNNNTIAGNSATGRSGAGLSTAGGVFHQGRSGSDSITLRNTIVANNTVNGVGGNCNIDAFNGNNSLQFGASDCPAAGFITGDPQLSALGFFGGPTKTMRPFAGSAAINKGDNAFALATDQRGVARPHSSADPTDIGSFEAEPPGPPRLESIVSGTPNQHPNGRGGTVNGGTPNRKPNR
ncbi:MAG: choice-of-anchor Q domain-containing protein [Chloroflexota bacterium]